MTYPLGAKPDRYDPRDYLFPDFASARARAREAAAIDRKFYTMVNKDFRIDQGNEGTCVGHAATNLLLAGPSAHQNFSEFATESLAHQFARALYLRASGDVTYQQGMYPRDACATLRAEGFVESYWKVLQVEDIITALLTFGPVMIAVPWYESMYAPVKGYVRVNLNSAHVGYHALAVTGIDMAPDDGSLPFVRLQNSWGSEWGTNGTARLTIENLRKLNIWDNWTFAESSF